MYNISCYWRIAVHGSNSDRSDLRFEVWKPVFVQRDLGVYTIDLLREICNKPVLKRDFTAHGIIVSFGISSQTAQWTRAIQYRGPSFCAVDETGPTLSLWSQYRFLDEIQTKVLKFSSLLFTVTVPLQLSCEFLFLHIKSLYSFYSSITVHWKETGGEPDRKPYPLLYGLTNPYIYLKSENSQDYAQKPQQNCTFMNSASDNAFLCNDYDRRKGGGGGGRIPMRIPLTSLRNEKSSFQCIACGSLNGHSKCTYI